MYSLVALSVEKLRTPTHCDCTAQIDPSGAQRRRARRDRVNEKKGRRRFAGRPVVIHQSGSHRYGYRRWNHCGRHYRIALVLVGREIRLQRRENYALERGATIGGVLPVVITVVCVSRMMMRDLRFVMPARQRSFQQTGSTGDREHCRQPQCQRSSDQSQRFGSRLQVHGNARAEPVDSQPPSRAAVRIIQTCLSTVPTRRDRRRAFL